METLTFTVTGANPQTYQTSVQINVDPSTGLGTGTATFLYIGNNAGNDTVVATLTSQNGAQGSPFTSNQAGVAFQAVSGPIAVGPLTLQIWPNQGDASSNGYFQNPNGTPATQTLTVNALMLDPYPESWLPGYTNIYGSGNGSSIFPPVVPIVTAQGTWSGSNTVLSILTSIGPAQEAWTGSFIVSQAGTYTFYADSADGTYLGIGGGVTYGPIYAFPPNSGGVTPLLGLPIVMCTNMSGSNQHNISQSITFPTAGIYPFEATNAKAPGGQYYCNYIYSSGVFNPVNMVSTPSGTPASGQLQLTPTGGNSNIFLQGQQGSLTLNISGIQYPTANYLPFLEGTIGGVFIFNSPTSNVFTTQTFNGLGIDDYSPLFVITGDNGSWQGLIGVAEDQSTYSTSVYRLETTYPNGLLNPGFESNNAGTPYRVNITAGNLVSDNWTVYDEQGSWQVFLDNTPGFPLSGIACLELVASGFAGTTVPANTTYETRVYSNSVAVTPGTTLLLGGYRDIDNNQAVPAGLQVLSRIGVQFYNSGNAAIGEAYPADLQFTGPGGSGWQFVSYATTVPSGAAVARVECAAFVVNGTGSPISIPNAGSIGDCRFDDLFVFAPTGGGAIYPTGVQLTNLTLTLPDIAWYNPGNNPGVPVGGEDEFQVSSSGGGKVFNIPLYYLLNPNFSPSGTAFSLSPISIPGDGSTQNFTITLARPLPPLQNGTLPNVFWAGVTPSSVSAFTPVLNANNFLLGWTFSAAFPIQSSTVVATMTIQFVTPTITYAGQWSFITASNFIYAGTSPSAQITITASNAQPPYNAGFSEIDPTSFYQAVSTIGSFGPATIFETAFYSYVNNCNGYEVYAYPVVGGVAGAPVALGGGTNLLFVAPQSNGQFLYFTDANVETAPQFPTNFPRGTQWQFGYAATFSDGQSISYIDPGVYIAFVE